MTGHSLLLPDVYLRASLTNIEQTNWRSNLISQISRIYKPDFHISSALGVLRWLFFKHECVLSLQWTTTCPRRRTCCYWRHLRRSSRSGSAGSLRRSLKSLRAPSGATARPLASPLKSRPASRWGEPAASYRLGKPGEQTHPNLRCPVLCPIDLDHV